MLLRSLFLVVAGVVLAASSPAQTFNVYEGELENGWQNWSWCSTDLSNADYVRGSDSHSIKATYTAGYQGLYFHYGPFASGYFSALSFYINGGTKAGRSISVAAIVDGNATNSVDLNSYLVGAAKVPAGAWAQVLVPLSDLGVASTDRIEGFWLQESTGSSQQAFWVTDVTWVPTAPPATVHIAVNANGHLQTVSPKVYGLNTAVWDSGFSSAACIGRLQEAHYRSFRFPGGSLSDTYHWKTNTTDQNTWTWETSFDTFAGVTKSKAATSFITVNYGTGTPSEAAGWVQYANVTKKYGYKYWEVGNECYGGWETDTHARANDPTIYAQQFKLYYNAMKAKDPTIKVGAVANPGEDSFATYTDHPATNPRTGLQHNGWTPVMLATLKGEGVTPDFIIYHNYPQAGNESDFGLLQSTSGWATDIGSLRQMLTDYLGADTAAKVQIDCTENNSDATSPGKQMCSLVNGLYLADSFGSMLQTECQSMMWWDLLNGQDTGGNNASWLYGWRQYGDYGVVDADFNPYPVFYVHKLLSVFATSGDSVLPVTTDYGLLTAYAVARQSGTLQLLVVNKNPTATLSAQISLSGYIPQPDAKTYSYGIPQDNAAQTGAGSPDVASGGISNAGPTTVLSFPPYSATVIVFKKQSYFFPG